MAPMDARQAERPLGPALQPRLPLPLLHDQTETPKRPTACPPAMAPTDPQAQPRRKPAVRLVPDDFDGAYDDAPSPYAAAA